MSESNKKEDWQRLEVIEIIDNPDGTAEIVFELEDEFREWFKESFGLKRWSDKKFQKVLLEAIGDYVEKEGKDDRDKEK